MPVESGGASIEGELYELEDSAWFDSLLPNEPPELRAGTIALDDGQTVHAMILELDRAGKTIKETKMPGHPTRARKR